MQAASLPPALAGHDILARAKTGTGKTIAFCLPAIEVLCRINPHPKAITVLAISPTRELAAQIAEEAKQLLHFHPYKVSTVLCRRDLTFLMRCQVQITVGGTNIKAERSRLAKDRCDMLVATPGRLIDHLTAGMVNGMDLHQKMLSMRCLILDEADQLLEMGFRKEIEKILGLIPRERQTLLFSATIPEGIKQIAKLAMTQAGGNYQYVDTIGEDAVNTLEHVPQWWHAVTMEQQLPAMLTIVREFAQVPNYKIIVFCVTARQTQQSAEAFIAMGIPALQIHSRMSQSARTKTSDKFRDGTNMIMFSSDVSARGMDYPDVTFVLQVGVPSDRAQYIHRIGRTARAGKSGSGYLLLHDFETYFLNDVKDLPLRKAHLEIPLEAYETARYGLSKVDHKTSEQAYQAWLGYYNSQRRLRWSKPELVQQANLYAQVGLGLDYQPALEKKTIGKMGLKGVPGLRFA